MRRSLGFAVRFAILWTLLCTQATAQDAAKTLERVHDLFQKNEYAAAVDMLQSLPEDTPPQQHLAKHLSLAQALMNLGRHAEALPHIEEARTIARQQGDKASQAEVEIAEGNYRRWTQERGEALSALNRAAELAAAAGNRRILAEAYIRMSAAYSDVEDWARTMYYSEKSFELRDSPTIIDRFNRAMKRGIASFELYDRDAAEASLLEGLALAVQSGGKRNEGWAHGELAFVYWTFDKDARRAIEHYDLAVALTRQADTPDQETTWLLNRGNVYRDTGDFAHAIADYQQVVAIEKLKNFQLITFAATKNIAQCYRLMGRLQDALNILKPLVENRPGNPSPRHLWQAHMELGATYEALGQAALAEPQYRAMLDVLEEQRNTGILDSFRTGSFAHSLSAYDPYERFIRFLAGQGEQHAAETFQLSEKARARSFLEMLASVRSSVAASLPGPLLEEQHRIMSDISSAQQKLRAPDVPKSERDALLAQLTKFENDRDRFLVKLRLEHPVLADTRYPDVLGPRELQPFIRPGETIVSFFLAEPESFRWTLTRNQVRFQRLPGRAQIETQTERLRRLISSPGDAMAARREADALAALLLPGLDITAGSGLVIIPHGVLHYIPFEILPHRGEMLIERHTVSYASSMNSLAFLRRQPSPNGPFRVLAMGAPTLNAHVEKVASRAGDAVESVGLLEPLPFAAEELAAIRRTFPSSTKTLEGKDARESALRHEDLTAFRVLHFATHGLVSETHPSRSGLLLADEPGEDGLLQMDEIYKLGLRSDLVVLSACQTALGREVTGEGIVGLTRAFFYGGTRAVMATLWNLNDRFAAEFIGRFYAELGDGRSPEEALRQAKLAYIHDPRYAHPFYWSSLVLAGDGAHPLYTPPSNTWRLLLMTSAALAAVFFMALLIRTVQSHR